MRSTTCLNTNQAWRKLGQQRHQLLAGKPSSQHRYSPLVDAVELKSVFFKSMPSVVTFIAGPSITSL